MTGLSDDRLQAFLEACDGTDGAVERLDVERFLTELGFAPQNLPSGQVRWSCPGRSEQFFTNPRYLLIPPTVAQSIHATICNMLRREGYPL